MDQLIQPSFECHSPHALLHPCLCCPTVRGRERYIRTAAEERRMMLIDSGAYAPAGVRPLTEAFGVRDYHAGSAA